jgi:hypothetical protein
MQIAQRGTSGSTSSTGYLSVDRFIVNANGTSVTLAQSSDAPANTGLEYSMSFTRTASGQDFRHAVELPADGKAGRLDETLTVSYYAKINTGTANGTFQYRYAASALGGGNTQTVTTSDSLTTTWQRFTHTFTNADTVAAGDLSFSMLWSVDTNCTMYITGVQLEVGESATEFEHRPYTTELQLCQRYLPWFGSGTDDQLGIGYATGSTSWLIFIPWKVQTRVAPTGIIHGTDSNFQVGGPTSSGITCTALNFSAAGTSGGRVTGSVSSGLSSGQGTFLRSQNSSGYLYFTGCEL